MEDNELINLGSAPVLRKRKIFLIVSASLFAATILGEIGVIFGLEGVEELKDSTGGKIGAAIAVGVVLGVSAIVFLILALRQNNLFKNKAKMKEAGVAIWEELEHKRLEKEKIEAEKAQAEAAKKALVTPDIIADKEYKGLKAIVWIDTNKKLIQFSLPTGVFVKSTDKNKFLTWLLDSKEEVLEKTKIIDLNNLDNVELIHDSEEITETYLNGIRLHGDRIGSASGDLQIKTTTFHYYQVDFIFKDIDCPVVHIFFDNDRAKAETLYHTVKLLNGK